jgi:alkanesulfonate monooxygenase SsuD/methylene tetrahydromethanopterin reductase-like flavin-dependent oxidoreductase (luciferase family)
MRYGLLFNVDYHADVHGSPKEYYDSILDQVCLAEDLGYDTAWFGEHHYGGYSFGSPAVIATAAAMRTSRIRLGTGVSLVPLGQPLRLAEEYATLDVLSNGRLEYGAGRGFLNYAYRLLGVEPSESVERAHEGLELIAELWSAETRINHLGKFWKLEDYLFAPQPVQRPHPPIFVAASTTPESFVWAAEKGFNVCTAFFGRLGPDEVAANLDVYRASLAAHGYDPTSREVAVVVQMFIGDNARDVEAGLKYAMNYYNFLSDLFVRGGQAEATVHGFLAEARNGRLDMTKVAIGSPDEVRQRLDWIEQKFQPDLLLMETAQGGTPPSEAKRVLELFAKHFIGQ